MIPIRFSKAYLLLIAAILMVLSVPKHRSEKISGITIAALSPLWETLISAKQSLYRVFGYDSQLEQLNQQIQQLQLEKKLLQNEMTRLKAIILQEKALVTEISAANPSKKMLARHRDQLKERINFQLQTIPAQIILRSPATWNSSFWLNVGEEDNKKIGNEVIAKNSPVVVGMAIVGVIDYVGNRQSRVRLITDSGLTPSVRALRGDHYLAKGEIHGCSHPMWRSLGNNLKGVGFNYDFSDEEGLARDLRTGSGMPLLKLDDLLITTGMDGVFPPGLSVAVVTHIEPLHEGDFYYELKAKPVIENLSELSTVFVMPPYGEIINEISE